MDSVKYTHIQAVSACMCVCVACGTLERIITALQATLIRHNFTGIYVYVYELNRAKQKGLAKFSLPTLRSEPRRLLPFHTFLQLPLIQVVVVCVHLCRRMGAEFKMLKRELFSYDKILNDANVNFTAEILEFST